MPRGNSVWRSIHQARLCNAGEEPFDFLGYAFGLTRHWQTGRRFLPSGHSGSRARIEAGKTDGGDSLAMFVAQKISASVQVDGLSIWATKPIMPPSAFRF
jgi:hypothetical protein